MTQQELRSCLEGMAEGKYKEFSESLVPGVENMLGIRLPQLRKLAKKLAKEDWKEYLSWNDFAYFEEIMLQGMILGYVKAPAGEILEAAGQFIPRINNWSVNDSFCTTFQCASKNPMQVWDFLMQYKDSHKEFEVRVVAVMLMVHFLIPEYIEKTLEVLGALDTEEYYASMAAAWAFATAWAKFPQGTKAYLQEHPIDRETYKRMLQKCIESRRITEADKKWMREEREKCRCDSSSIPTKKPEAFLQRECAGILLRCDSSLTWRGVFEPGKASHLFYNEYQQFYQMAEASEVFHKYCQKAFGEDFSQDGFSDIRQIDRILEYIPQKEEVHILDIGCGNGKMLGYLQKCTDAYIHGFDYSSYAIQTACTLHPYKSEFRIGTMDEIEYADNSFDVIVSMDTMYFAKDMAGFAARIHRWLCEGGIFFAGYQEGDVMPKTADENTTELAKALKTNKIAYEVFTITEECYDLLQRKRSVAEFYKKEFEDAGETAWYEMLMQQTECVKKPYAEFSKEMARYLYVFRKK